MKYLAYMALIATVSANTPAACEYKKDSAKCAAVASVEQCCAQLNKAEVTDSDPTSKKKKEDDFATKKTKDDDAEKGICLPKDKLIYDDTAANIKYTYECGKPKTLGDKAVDTAKDAGVAIKEGAGKALDKTKELASKAGSAISDMIGCKLKFTDKSKKECEEKEKLKAKYKDTDCSTLKDDTAKTDCESVKANAAGLVATAVSLMVVVANM